MDASDADFTASTPVEGMVLDVPWVLSIIVRTERGVLLNTHDVFAAASAAMRGFFREAQVHGEWDEAINHWLDTNIRKVVRRARGAAWEKTLDLPGVTGTHNDAEVRVLAPYCISEIPRDVSRLQVSGLELGSEGVCDHAANNFFPDAPVTLQYAFNPAVASMSHGKRLAQFAHLVHYGITGRTDYATPEPLVDQWATTGYSVDEVPWESLDSSLSYVVEDAGYTEVPSGTQTIRGTWAVAPL